MIYRANDQIDCQVCGQKAFLMKVEQKAICGAWCELHVPESVLKNEVMLINCENDEKILEKER